jgi:hypothetical protein
MRARFAIAAVLLVLAAPARADDSPPTPPVVDLKGNVTWVPVEGTNKVLMVQQDQRPQYDIFSFDGKYWVYRKEHWFRSDTLNGTYALLAPDSVPAEFKTVPKERWVVYPTNWGSMGTSHGPGTVYGEGHGPGMTTSRGESAGGPVTKSDTKVAADWTPTISFTTAPKWTTVPGSERVYYVQKGERPKDYDLYRFDDRYYTYQKDNWYSASSVNGPYVLVKSDDVPMAFRTVKKTYWVSYPSGWTYVTPAAVKVKTR